MQSHRGFRDLLLSSVSIVQEQLKLQQEQIQQQQNVINQVGGQPLVPTSTHRGQKEEKITINKSSEDVVIEASAATDSQSVIGQFYEYFVRKRTLLVIYQFQSKISSR